MDIERLAHVHSLNQLQWFSRNEIGTLLERIEDLNEKLASAEDDAYYWQSEAEHWRDMYDELEGT